MADDQEAARVKPVWLMDVDGVLNICGWGDGRVAQTWGDTRVFNAMQFRIRVSPKVLDSVSSWMKEGLAEVRWLTSWEELANVHLVAELGWPELEVAGRYEDSVKVDRKFSGDIGWWKLEFAQAVYDTGVPVIWTDDDIAHAFDAMEWLATTDRDRMLAISPIAGLTPTNLDEIEEFIRRHTNEENA